MAAWISCWMQCGGSLKDHVECVESQSVSLIEWMIAEYPEYRRAYKNLVNGGVP